jgi:hypothetical protein
MSNTVYFLTDADGRCELSDGQHTIGHIEQIGVEFAIVPTMGSVLERMEMRSFPSKQEAMAAIEAHSDAVCAPAEPTRETPG